MLDPHVTQLAARDRIALPGGALDLLGVPPAVGGLAMVGRFPSVAAVLEALLRRALAVEESR